MTATRAGKPGKPGKPDKRPSATAAKAAGEAALQAWQAFADEAVAVFGGEPVSLQWCSPAFAQWLALPGPGVALPAVLARLNGLAEGWPLAQTGGRWQGAVTLEEDTASAGAAASASREHTADHPPPTHPQDHASAPAPARAKPARPAKAAAQATSGGDALSPPPPRQWQALLCALPGGGMALRLMAAPEEDSSRHAGGAHATRRHLEDRERLLFTSRSVAVGEMATTLAHELNQPLGAVTNVLRGLKARIDSAIAHPGQATLPMLAQGVQLALDQMQYASSIIGRVRDYTQSRQPQRDRVDLNALLGNSLTLLDWELQRSGVQLDSQLWADAHGHAPVMGDGVMLQQVLVNLLRNAIDAMDTTPAGQRRLDIASRVADGTHIEIAIADTGCGMGEEAAAQVFMPFASTKPTGMGIGLNICRSLIELHRGRLWFTRNAGAGCTFHIALPLALQDSATASTSEETA